VKSANAHALGGFAHLLDHQPDAPTAHGLVEPFTKPVSYHCDYFLLPIQEVNRPRGTFYCRKGTLKDYAVVPFLRDTTA
jgi:hypothetical protein